MLVLSLLITLAVLLVNLASIWLIQKASSEPPNTMLTQFPEVAILVACRNEEENIEACIKALLALDYPADKLKVYLGNDDSEDATAKILHSYAAQYQNIYTINITENWGYARAKANVLAQLARAAGNSVAYFFITDADIRPNPQWLVGLLKYSTLDAALVSGITLPTGPGFWAKYQRLDWLLALGWAKAYSVLPVVGQTLTAIGNNMLIRADAYWATGGYEAIPFSVTEDYELKVQVEKYGYRSVQVITPDSYATTQPIRNISGLINQRKRWMTGAARLPIGMLIILLVQALWLPAIVFLLYKYYLLAGIALVVKGLSQVIFASQIKRLCGNSERLPFMAFYELYSGLLSVFLVLYYLLPIPVTWKNRTYSRRRTAGL